MNQLIGNLKQIIRYIEYRTAYPKSNVAFGASIWGNSFLENNVRIEKGTFVSNSHLGRNVIVHCNCYVSGSTLEQDIRICSGCTLNDVNVGSFTYICEESRISRTKIGRFSSIGFQVICGRGIHPTAFISTSPVFFSTEGQCGTSFADRDYFDERKEIHLGNDVWIGDRVFIRDGTSIGNGSVVGAGAVVVNNIPDYAVVAGVPAKLIRFRFPEDVINDLLEIQWWNWDAEKLRKARGQFVHKDVRSFIEWARSFSPKSPV